MLKSELVQCKHQSGTSLLEVLVTVIILAFGLLGIAGLQSRLMVAEVESYQRAQAIILLSEMMERISANRSQAASYVTTGTIGTGNKKNTSCAGAPGVTQDICEWQNALKGTSEQIIAGGVSTNVGAMVDARGCISQVQAPVNIPGNPGTCAPGIYRVAVAWQGMHPTVTPAASCGQNLYGTNDKFRRVISATISIAPSSCS